MDDILRELNLGTLVDRFSDEKVEVDTVISASDSELATFVGMARKGGYLLADHLSNLLIQSQKPQSQLGDMKIICPEPVWTVLDAESCQKKIGE